MSEIITETADSILTITLNRPAKRNALNDALINDLKTALQTADQDKSLCAVVIKGAGKDFCSGADLSVLQKISESDVLENHADADNLRELFSLIRAVKIPLNYPRRRGFPARRIPRFSVTRISLRPNKSLCPRF